MPFTFSHPAAVLPLAYLPKRLVSMTGLIIGSMAPDFEYFFRMNGQSFYSHTWKGLFWFDLPLTIILAFIFHIIVRDRLVDNLPFFLYKRFSVFKNFNWIQHFKMNFLIVLVSIIIGICTHIIWDRFTHEQGLFLIEGHSFSKYGVLQNLSTLTGGLIIIYAFFQLPARSESASRHSIFPFWFSVMFITVTTVAIWLISVPGFVTFKDLVVATISGSLLGLILTPKILPQKL